jgi:hypothetical protein
VAPDLERARELGAERSVGEPFDLADEEPLDRAERLRDAIERSAAARHDLPRLPIVAEVRDRLARLAELHAGDEPDRRDPPMYVVVRLDDRVDVEEEAPAGLAAERRSDAFEVVVRRADRVDGLDRLVEDRDHSRSQHSEQLERRSLFERGDIDLLRFSE